MTFATDTVRSAFHQLPAQVQLDYVRLEEQLAKDEKFLRIDGVVRHGFDLEIIIRISEELEFVVPDVAK